MAVPTTNISFDDIWFEANNSNLVTTNNLTTTDLFTYDYFRGPNGLNAIGWNAWGCGNFGVDQIFGVTASASNWGQFSGLDYWYDNFARSVKYTVDNTLAVPTPPSRPDENDCNVFIDLKDSTDTYTYLTSNNITANASTTVGPVTFSQAGYGGTPLLLNIYWTITVQSSPSWVFGNMDIKINGATFNTVTINNGTNVFVWNGNGGSSTIDANAVSGVEFLLIIY
jgi:hypothetical protein